MSAQDFLAHYHQSSHSHQSHHRHHAQHAHPESQEPDSDFWEPIAPSPSELGDHDVPLSADWLAGRQIALLVSGGIAAFRAPGLARALRKHGAQVTAFVSAEALRYVTADALAWATNRPVVTSLSARAEHLGDGQIYDAYLVAPATYNTINKFRHGIADSLLSTLLASALGRLQRGQSRILLAPTMHGSMHNAILEDSLVVLQELGVTVIPPRDAYGKHNLPDDDEIVHRLARALSDSPLRGQHILVTGGPTPVPIDKIRRITTRFSGELGLELARQLYIRGAEVHWVHGISQLVRPSWLPCHQIESYDEYLQTVMFLIEQHDCVAGVFSAAVADYRPESVYDGKLPSGGKVSEIRLTPTLKVIDEVHQRFPELALVSFKFEAGISHAGLMDIARTRLQRGHGLVVANRQEEQTTEQIAWLVEADHETQFAGKPAIASAVVDWLEQHLMPEPVEVDFENDFGPDYEVD